MRVRGEAFAAAAAAIAGGLHERDTRQRCLLLRGVRRTRRDRKEVISDTISYGG